jgi:hypothetical protein
LDEVADPEMRPMLPIFFEEYLSLLRVLDEEPAPCEVFAG